VPIKRATAGLAADESRGHSVSPLLARADEVLDGAYVAYRGKPDSSEAKTWVPMKDGVEVRDLDAGCIEILLALH
jgi:hypothetical protein